MIAATAMCAAAATEAAAQDGSIVLNNQLQLGDVIAGQTLDVVDVTEQVTVTNAAQGNALSGAVQGGSLELTSTQTMSGDARATTTLTLGGDTSGPVNAVTQARGNYLAAGVYGADLTLDATQVVNGSEISAATTITGDDARLLGGAYVDAGAFGNTVAVGAEGSHIQRSVDQRSSALIRATNFAVTQYIPAEAEFTTQALANAVAVTGQNASSQDLAVTQRSTGSLVEADVSANAGNAWDLAGRANAGGNQAILANQGGSLVTRTDQTNDAYVRAAAIVTAFDYGALTGQARGVGNEVQAGNNDLHVQIDNSQLNTGGVDVSAGVSGGNGYDIAVGADAAGNVVTGYACAECEAVLIATNHQTNQGDVTATANATVSGSSRSVIAGANAVGNSATFYVSRPGH
jgi:hypothetical protein